MILNRKAAFITAVVILTFVMSGAAQPNFLLFEKLAPLHQVKRTPGPYDWLAVQNEPGQTFDDYIKSHPPRPDKTTQYIYISLLGPFDHDRQNIIEKTARLIEAYYQLEVRFADPIPLSVIPAEAQRLQPLMKNQQILSTYVIDKLLLPRKPADAFCYIAFTTADLWPGPGWNFVFGQASLEDRVGVWSIYRNGDPAINQKDYQICLRRTISTGIHEIGHMFGLHHCIYYECNMNGSNHRQESDARPLWLCPVCLRKLTYILDIEPLERYKNLATISQELGLGKEADFYQKSWHLIAAKQGSSESIPSANVNQ